MSENLIKPYELSLWKDKQYFVCYNGTDYKTIDDKSSIGSGYVVVNDFFAEVKLGILSTEQLSSPLDAYDLKLVRNLNGKNDLTFSMHTHYWDNDANELKVNAWKSLVTNEQKVKLNYDGEWFDFIIKKSEESSDGKTITYTCTDLFIEELSKNGYAIELNGDLMNNMGTATELAQVVLDGSEWQLASDTETIRQLTSETLFDYEIISPATTKTLVVMDNFSYDGESYTKGQELTVPVGDHLYIFYSSVENAETNYQVLYSPTGKYVLDSNSVILSAPNCYVKTGSTFTVSDPIISKYRGKKLIESPKSKYIGVLDQTCTIYTHEDTSTTPATTKTYYCQEGLEYLSGDSIKDLITNNISFTTTDGWYTSTGSSISIDRQTIGTTNTNVLTIHFGSGTTNWIGNNGFSSLRSNLSSGLTVGEKYELLLKEYNTSGTRKIDHALLKITLKNATDPLIYTFTYVDTTSDYNRYEMSVGTSISYTQLLESTIDFQIYGTASNTTYLTAAKLFIYKTTEDGTLIIPDLTEVEKSVVKTTYKMYEILKVDDLTSADDLVYDFVFNTIPSGWTQVMEPNYAKVSSITAEKSNRFNLIQEIAEKFECWAKFSINHNSNGSNIYNYNTATDARYISGKSYFKKAGIQHEGFVDEEYSKCTITEIGNFFTQLTSGSTYSNSAYYYYYDTDSTSVIDYYYVALTKDEFDALSDKTKYYSLKANWKTIWQTIYTKTYEKYIGFHEYIGQDNHIGFRYGINLKEIKRSLDSDAIVTKLIVAANSNEYDEDGYGSCSIANSDYNNIKENFILNLDYYIKQGILDEDVVLRDLYDQSNTNGIGYLTKLGKLNKDNKSLIQSQSNLTVSRLLANASYTKYVESREEAKTNRDNYDNYLKSSGISKPSGSNYYSETGNEQVVSWAKKYNTYYNSYNEFDELVDDFADRVADYDKALASVNSQLTRISNAKEGLNQTFNTKYSRYLREGQWISEDYTSADKYYLDAKNVLYNSAYPQVSYTISVVDLSAIEEYNIYQFNLADETYIEDVEFFGKTNGRPVQEKVVITQITYNLNNPSDNTITIKNYDNRWESLFQKITATTDSLQFHEGEYNRVAETVDETGTIKTEYLKGVFANNSVLAEAISNEINSKGESIELINKDAEKIIRIGSNGIALTKDGGDTWTTAITADGINANKINTGQLNTENILIYAGTDASFIWDKDNLTAYGHDGGIVNRNKKVQFSQKGIYGYENSETPTFKLGYDGFELNALNNIAYTAVSSFVSNRHYFMKDGDAYTELDFNTPYVVSMYELPQTHNTLSISSTIIGNSVTELNAITFNLTRPSAFENATSYKITITDTSDNEITSFGGTFDEDTVNYIHTYTKSDFDTTTTSISLKAKIEYLATTSLGNITITFILYNNNNPTYTAVNTDSYTANIAYYIKQTDPETKYVGLGYLNYQRYDTYYQLDNNNNSIAITTYASAELSKVDELTQLRPIIKAKKGTAENFILYEDGSIYANKGKFRGDIYADNGYFKGDITGATGTFSGSLAATAGYFGGITLDGTNNKILIYASQTSPSTAAHIEITNESITISGYEPGSSYTDDDVKRVMGDTYSITHTTLTGTKIESPLITGCKLQTDTATSNYVTLDADGIRYGDEGAVNVVNLGYHLPTHRTEDWNLPTILFGCGGTSGVDKGMIRKYGYGIWIGDDDDWDYEYPTANPSGSTNGILVAFADYTYGDVSLEGGKIYKFMDGQMSEIGSAVFA